MAVATLANVGLSIVAALSADLGTYDFSGTGAVLRGRYAEPPGGRARFIGVASPSFASIAGPPLRKYERTLVYDLWAWAAYDGRDANASTIAGELLLQEIVDALDDAHADPTSTMYGLREYACQGAVLDSDIDPVPQRYASCVVQVSCKYGRTAGA